MDRKLTSLPVQSQLNKKHTYRSQISYEGGVCNHPKHAWQRRAVWSLVLILQKELLGHG